MQVLYADRTRGQSVRGTGGGLFGSAAVRWGGMHGNATIDPQPMPKPVERDQHLEY